MKYSAGLVLVRSSRGDGHGTAEPEVLLVHPGGPFWSGKDAHAWSIPKGEYDPDGEPGLDAAYREFEEELGQPVPAGPSIELPEITTSGKVIRAWLIDLRAADHDTLAAFDRGLASVAERSNTFEIEWPPRSGKRRHFPEVDTASWIPLSTLTDKLHKGQASLATFVAAYVGT